MTIPDMADSLPPLPPPVNITAAEIEPNSITAERIDLTYLVDLDGTMCIFGRRPKLRKPTVVSKQWKPAPNVRFLQGRRCRV